MMGISTRRGVHWEDPPAQPHHIGRLCRRVILRSPQRTRESENTNVPHRNHRRVHDY